ncbi:MAG: SGNH/GDSL hydrolase family protein, partial [Muribaculaceae bacterium]|nr:SGNH/GDSL hydrolase family protein [Muribaculaceae bacterium]
SIEATDDKGDVVSIPTTGVAEDGIYTVTVDLDTYNVTFSPITYVCVEGSVVGGWNTTGKEMTYQGNGVWQFAGLLEGYDTPSDPGRFNFVLNKDWGQTYKRVEGSLDKVSKEGATKDIPLNPGNYRISLDLNNLTFAVANGADETDHARITVMGSSVPNGQGATDNHGYAYLYGEELAARYAAEQSTTPFYISNISINGNSSVNLLDRFDDLQREYGDYVIYGISLGNEGIHEATDKEAIANQYKTNLQKLITDARADGKTPVVMNNYTRTDFTADDYSYLKSVNREMGYWDVPSVNLLGAIDNGQGQWADGYGIDSDIYHPNDLGHHEFFYAMVPSMFDALASGKTLTMSRQIPASGYNLPEATSIVFEPEGTVHSFTLALSVDMPNDGLVAKVVLADGGNLTIVREGTFYFLYKDD